MCLTWYWPPRKIDAGEIRLRNFSCRKTYSVNLSQLHVFFMYHNLFDPTLGVEQYEQVGQERSLMVAPKKSPRLAGVGGWKVDTCKRTGAKSFLGVLP